MPKNLSKESILATLGKKSKASQKSRKKRKKKSMPKGRVLTSIEEVQEEVVQRMADLNLRVGALAESSGLSRELISGFVHGRFKPKLASLQKLLESTPLEGKIELVYVLHWKGDRYE